jgi:hypothetical protein
MCTIAYEYCDQQHGQYVLNVSLVQADLAFKSFSKLSGTIGRRADGQWDHRLLACLKRVL